MAILFLLDFPIQAAPLDPPSPEALREARALVAEMKGSERGPYSRLRWFCNDGTVQPPVAFACRDRGGGRQHAEYSPARRRLADLGWSVGTIFAALEWSELWQSEERQLRLRELPLERYLIDVDDGWVLRRAQFYRGRVQIEDEERAGRGLLLRLMEQVEWISGHFLLIREITRIIPHGTGEDLTRHIRHAAQGIAEKDKSFERLRVETHSSPSAATAERIRTWASARGRDAGLAREANALGSELDRLYGSTGRAERLADAIKRLARFRLAKPFAARLSAVNGENQLVRLKRLSATMREMRDLIINRASTPALRLELFDLLRELEAEVRVLSSEVVSGRELSRSVLFSIAAVLTDAAYGAGMLSNGEHAAIMAAVTFPAGDKSVDLDEYVRRARSLNLVNTWAVGSVRYAFAEALVRYAALEPRSAHFVDDLLRSSVLLPLAEISGQLLSDAQRLAGVQRQFFGKPVTDLLALNPGMARGPLRVVTDSEMSIHPLPVKRGDIVVLPEAVAELPPVSGILTVGESNPLSHVQLLARNFGIPNLSITPALHRVLKEQAGDHVVVAAGSDGSVFIGSEGEAGLTTSHFASAAEEKLDVPLPDLSFGRPIPLADLNRSLSGRLVGPKAANLGELNLLFPGRVAAAIALPFGAFHEQTSGSKDAPRERLDLAYDQFRTGRIGADALSSELESIRQSIAALEVRDPLKSTLLGMMSEQFGPPGTYGVFIRSDTNVEDLPGFTGAGLSLTLPHVVGIDAQLAGIPKVWASVLSPRAIAWRSNLLKRPESIYASVLLMKSVPADKSGVLVTTDLANRRAGLTVSTAWGVGGAVAGETTET
ncbi:MAG TPA: PEP/pyruvate-binding domain-containing protein, partial [Gammaproteobacteria bacterium]|nr:PEP/pyruvate-binding domain-containing protein [Gammaproteobacteria bacterium]